MTQRKQGASDSLWRSGLITHSPNSPPMPHPDESSWHLSQPWLGLSPNRHYNAPLTSGTYVKCTDNWLTPTRVLPFTPQASLECSVRPMADARLVTRECRDPKMMCRIHESSETPGRVPGIAAFFHLCFLEAGRLGWWEVGRLASLNMDGFFSNSLQPSKCPVWTSIPPQIQKVPPSKLQTLSSWQLALALAGASFGATCLGTASFFG